MPIYTGMVVDGGASAKPSAFHRRVVGKWDTRLEENVVAKRPGTGGSTDGSENLPCSYT